RDRHPQETHDAAEPGKAGAERKRERCAIMACKSKAQRSKRCAGGLSDQARGRRYAARGPGAMRRRTPHDRLQVRRLEEAESESAKHHAPDDVGHARLAGSNARSAMPSASSTRPRPPRMPAEKRSDSRPPIGAMIATTSGHGVMKKPVSTCERPRMSSK